MEKAVKTLHRMSPCTPVSVPAKITCDLFYVSPQDGFLPKAVSKSNLTNTTLGKPNGVARGLPEIANYTALPKIPVATSKNNSSAFPTSFPSIINKEKKKLQVRMLAFSFFFYIVVGRISISCLLIEKLS